MDSGIGDANIPNSTTERNNNSIELRSGVISEIKKDNVSNDDTDIPCFSITEISLGDLIGRGTFCDIHEINGIHLMRGDPDPNGISEENSRISEIKVSSNTLTDGEATKKLDEPVVNDKNVGGVYERIVKIDVKPNPQEMRRCMAANCKEKGRARYVIKRLNENTRSNTAAVAEGIVDLVRETIILSSIKHSSIIAMKGIATGNMNEAEHFIILDKLHETLTERLAKWKNEDDWAFFNQNKRNDMMMKRLNFVLDLASAFRHLHENRIIHRDIKPDNIGFDINENVKLFDFGLATSMPCNDCEDDVYKLSGEIGSFRYMAPEVRRCEPYNHKADVFSFSILMWQMMTLRIPFSNCNSFMLKKMVVSEGLRPSIDDAWSDQLKCILQNSWKDKIADRIDIKVIYNALSSVLKQYNENYTTKEESWTDFLYNRYFE